MSQQNREKDDTVACITKTIDFMLTNLFTLNFVAKAKHHASIFVQCGLAMGARRRSTCGFVYFLEFIVFVIKIDDTAY